MSLSTGTATAVDLCLLADHVRHRSPRASKPKSARLSVATGWPGRNGRVGYNHRLRKCLTTYTYRP